jgi:hypothetical protein
MVRCFTADVSCWQRHIKTDAARRRLWRNANVASGIVRRAQSTMRKPVALFGRPVAPLPAVANFLDFFARDWMTVLVVAALLVIPAVDKHDRD